MDQSVLVKAGHALVKAMDEAKMPPRIAMWVLNGETNIWKLWIVPPRDIKDKQEFYRKTAAIISKLRQEVGDFSVADVEMISEAHPAMNGLGKIFRIDGLSAVQFSGNSFNGYYLPDGIILRSNLARSN